MRFWIDMQIIGATWWEFAASGNRNWGSLFARAADVIATKFRVPVLHKFELAGSEQDVQIFTERVKEIEQVSRNQCADGCAV